MIEIKDDEWGWKKTPHLLFHDRGLAKRNGTTHIWNVHLTNRELIGYVKWEGRFFGYVFHVLQTIFASDWLYEITLFCDELTCAHMSRRPFKKRTRDLAKKRREKRREAIQKKSKEFKEKLLTKRSEHVTMCLEVEEKESSGSEVLELVEGESLYDFS